MQNPRVATYNRISKEDRNKDETALIRQQWETSTVAARLNPVFLSFTDQLTGKRSDRPDFQKLLALIENKQIDIIVVSKIDRLGRDHEFLGKLSNLLQRSGVQVYEILLGRLLDWNNPSDWSYFANSSVKAEEEIRRSSHRIKLAFEWRKSQGKPGGGGTPFGFHRVDGFYRINPEQRDAAIALVKIIIDCNGTTAQTAIRAREELGLEMSRVGFYGWIRCPTIRGATVWGEQVKWGTHESLFDCPELKAIDAEKKIDAIISDSSRMRGGNRSHTQYPLSGLLYCARCGGHCHIKKISSSKYPTNTYTYIMCGKRVQNASDCGGRYGAYMGRRGSINTRYDQADQAVMDALRESAVPVVERAAQSPSPTAVESVEVKKIRADITKLEDMNDPDLADVITRKRSILQNLLMSQIDTNARNRYKKQKLIQIIQEHPRFFEEATDEEKKALYKEFVGRVECDRSMVVVKLLI